MHECQSRGVSPSCIKHLRLLKQFLNSLSAVKRGAPTPIGAGLHQSIANIAKTEADSYPEEEDSFGANYDETDARLVVETGISPPSSPASRSASGKEERTDQLDEEELSRNNLRVISPQDINSNSEAVSTKRRSSSQEEISGPVKRPRCTSKESEGKPSTAEALQKFQAEMVDRFLAFQRESEVRLLAWEQERWRMEQTLLERCRAEQRSHEKEMFSMFCNLLSQCSQTILDNRGR